MHFFKILYVSFKDTFDKISRDKANISNPKVKRGCAPLTANRTSADCVQISLGPSIPYIPLGVYHTGRFNTMCRLMRCVELINTPVWNGNLRMRTPKFPKMMTNLLMITISMLMINKILIFKIAIMILPIIMTHLWKYALLYHVRWYHCSKQITVEWF